MCSLDQISYTFRPSFWAGFVLLLLFSNCDGVIDSSFDDIFVPITAKLIEFRCIVIFSLRSF